MSDPDKVNLGDLPAFPLRKQSARLPSKSPAVVREIPARKPPIAQTTIRRRIGIAVGIVLCLALLVATYLKP